MMSQYHRTKRMGKLPVACLVWLAIHSCFQTNGLARDAEGGLRNPLRQPFHEHSMKESSRTCMWSTTTDRTVSAGVEHHLSPGPDL
jgi:hypothetical protein